jgi:putative hydrolase of the HAD superfamily
MPAHSPAPIQAVLFDYGVVLSGPPHPSAWREMVAITGLSESEFSAAYWAPRHEYDRGALTGAAYWRVAAQHAGLTLTDAQVADLLAADDILWTQRNEPMVAWAQRLQAAGMRTGILSNLGDAMTAGVLARQPWLARFDYQLWSYQVKMAKPELEIYRIAIDGLGVDASTILFIDDRATNVTAALECGLQAILYVSQPEFEAEMERRSLGHLLRLGEGR